MMRPIMVDETHPINHRGTVSCGHTTRRILHTHVSMSNTHLVGEHDAVELGDVELVGGAARGHLVREALALPSEDTKSIISSYLESQNLHA